MMCPGLALCEESGRALSVKLGDHFLLLSGAIRLKCDGHDITDVVDSAGKVSLVVNQVGGAAGNNPFVESLRWLQK